MEFLLSLGEITDAELSLVTFSFIRDLLLNNKELFFSCFSIDFLLATFNSADSRIIEIAISLMMTLISTDIYYYCKTDDKCIERIMTIIIKGMFTNFQENDIRSSIHIIISAINNNLCTQQQIVQLVCSNLTFESPEAHEFSQVMMMPTMELSTNLSKILRATKKMILVYKKPIQNV